MAKRFTDTELWDKEWFMKLSPRLKCFVKMVRDKCDLSGVWSPNYLIASTYVGEPVTEAELINIDGGKQFRKISSGKIFCIGFIQFQYGKLSTKSPVHRKIIQILDTHSIPYQYPINSLKEKEEDKEEDKEEEKAMEEEKEGGGAAETSLPLEMKKVWLEKKPRYPFDNFTDLQALTGIYYFIHAQLQDAKNKDDPSFGNTVTEEEMLTVWDQLAETVLKEKFWKEKSLTTISNHIQEFWNKANKNGNNLDTEAILNRKIDEMFG